MKSKATIVSGLTLSTLLACAPSSHAQSASPAESERSTAKVATANVSSGNAPADYSLREGFIDAHGVLIYYMTVGRGAPLLIVHGGPGASHDYFLPHLLPLARHNRLIFIDERGSGKSQILEDPAGYTVENMVEDVEAVRQGLALGKISLLGHSYGGVWRRLTR